MTVCVIARKRDDRGDEVCGIGIVAKGDKRVVACMEQVNRLRRIEQEE